MTTFAKPSILANAMTLPAAYYRDSAVFERERERVFGRNWLCVGREERVERPGDFFLAEVAGESLIVTRDARGDVRAHYNVCRHRGTRMCTQSEGRFTGSIQCPYHAWTYALDGTLKAARNMSEVPGFDRRDYPLRQAATACWEGFVFVNLSASPEPFEQAFAPLIGRFRDWNIASLRTARSIEYDLACNWKLVFLNYSECYHCPLVHPQLDKLSPSDSGRNDLTTGPFLGGFSELRHPGGSLTTTGTSGRAPVGNVHGDNLNRVYYYTVFPSLLLSLHPDYVMTHTMEPTSPERTKIVCSWLFDPKTMAQPGFDPSDAVDFWDLTNRQDWNVSELTQLGLTSRAYEPGPYSNAEGLLGAFDAHYLTALEEN